MRMKFNFVKQQPTQCEVLRHNKISPYFTSSLTESNILESNKFYVESGGFGGLGFEGFEINLNAWNIKDCNEVKYAASLKVLHKCQGNPSSNLGLLSLTIESIKFVFPRKGKCLKASGSKPELHAIPWLNVLLSDSSVFSAKTKKEKILLMFKLKGFALDEIDVVSGRQSDNFELI